jgi:hypothetical protein
MAITVYRRNVDHDGAGAGFRSLGIGHHLPPTPTQSEVVNERSEDD